MNSKVKTIAYIGLLTAAVIILSRFVPIVNVVTVRISFAFLPIVVAAIVLGPWQAAVVAALGDVIGALLVPTGPYFPGFTITAALVGLELGLFLFKQRSILYLVIATAIHQIVFSLFIDTIWIKIITGSSYAAMLLTRLPECLLHFVIETVVIIFFADKIRKLRPILLDNL